MELLNKRSIIIFFLLILYNFTFAVKINVNKTHKDYEQNYHNFYINASIEHELEEIKDIYFISGEYKIPLNFIEKNSYLTIVEDHLNLEFLKNEQNPKCSIEVVYKVPGGDEKILISEEYIINLNKITWNVEGGGSSYHDFSFSNNGGITRIVDDWNTPIDGDILIAPITFKNYLICAYIDRSNENILKLLDLNNGKELYRVNINDLLGINTTYSIRSITADEDKNKLFIAVSNMNGSYLVIHELFKNNDIIINDLEFTNSIKMMQIRDYRGRNQVLVYGFNKDHIYKIYSFSYHGGYELIFKKEIDNILVSYLDVDNISSLVKIPRNVFGDEFSIGVLLGNEFYILSDIYNNYFEYNTTIENEYSDKFSLYIRYHKDKFESRIYLNYNNNYYYTVVENNRLRFINTYVENIRTDNFNVADDSIYTFNYSDGFYIKKMTHSGFVEKQLLLTKKEDYLSEYFVQAFDLAPLISDEYIICIDKNYTLFLLQENKININVVAKRSLPKSVYTKKRNANMIPFGNSINKIHDKYYNQPEIIVNGDRIIVTTGEDAPNWIVSYRIK